MDRELELQTFAQTLSMSRSIVILTGAGISVSAGFSTFLNAAGKYDSMARGIFDRATLGCDSSKLYKKAAELVLQKKEAPATVTHDFFRYLLSRNMLSRIYSQNFDGLEEYLGTGPKGILRLSDKTIFLHGQIDRVCCSLCRKKTTLNEHILKEWKSGKAPPCEFCQRTTWSGRRVKVGVLGPDIALYNDAVDQVREEAIYQAQLQDSKEIDMFIIVGTSMRQDVSGALQMTKTFCKFARSHAPGRKVIFYINPNPPPSYIRKEIDQWIGGESDSVFRRTLFLLNPKAVLHSRVKRTASCDTIQETGLELEKRKRPAPGSLYCPTDNSKDRKVIATSEYFKKSKRK